MPARATTQARLRVIPSHPLRAWVTSVLSSGSGWVSKSRQPGSIPGEHAAIVPLVERSVPQSHARELEC